MGHSASHMTVEVTVRALCLTERPVDVEAQVVWARPIGPRRMFHVKHFRMTAATARALWLVAAFLVPAISP
jgi:hypothetical protein